MEAKSIAFVAYEANRAYQQVIGQDPSPVWSELSGSDQDRAVREIEATLAGVPASEQHDEQRRTDPNLAPECQVPYDELSEDERRKDTLWAAVARSLV